MIPSPRWFPDIAWLKEEIARRYDVGPIAACVLIHQSFNRVYRIEAQAGRFVLRVSGGRSQAACETFYELDLLSYLVRRGIPVVAPVATRGGAFVWEIDATDGRRTAVLFADAPGEYLIKPFPSGAFGRTAAALHAALDEFGGSSGPMGLNWRYLVEEPIAAVQSFLPHRTDVGDYLTRVGSALRRRLDELGTGLDVGACHGDLHPRNAYLAVDGTITLFDFECCGPGWRAYELAVLRWWQYFTRQPEECWTVYLAEYQKCRRLEPADLAAIPLFVAVRHIRLLGAGVWLAGFDGVWRPDDQHIDRRLTSLAGLLA